MKIVKAETLSCDGLWQNWSFLKLTTDEGMIGWSECRDGQGILQLIERMAQKLIGEDPRLIGRIDALLYAQTRIADGGIASQAAAAITNACLDIKAKALGVPVADLFGGAIRDKMEVYWSHCGMFRARYPDFFEKEMGLQGLRKLEDCVTMGKEAVERGYRSLKTNVFMFDGPGPRVHGPGFGRTRNHPELNVDDDVLKAIDDEIAAYREGAGPAMGIKLDLNFNYKPEGLRRIARRLEHHNLSWLEMDVYEPQALARVRDVAAMPIASLEAIYGRRHLLPYLQHGAVDVAIIDVIWNGMMESHRMASLCDAFEVNVAAHTFASPFQAFMGAQLAACIPNFRVLEFEGDQPHWQKEVFTHLPEIVDGAMLRPTRPGWGTDINEEAVRARPAKPSAQNF